MKEKLYIMRTTKSIRKMNYITKYAKTCIQNQIDILSSCVGIRQPEDLFEAIETHNPCQLKRILRITKTRLQYQTDTQGRPPICKAAQLGYEDLISIMIEHGFDPHLHDDRCWFAAHYAAQSGHHGIIYLLISQGKPMYIWDKEGGNYFKYNAKSII